jgi:WD40 repeat protein
MTGLPMATRTFTTATPPRILFAVVLVLFSSIRAAMSQPARTLPFVELTHSTLGDVFSIRWKPDSSLLAVASEMGIWLFTPDLRTIARLTDHTHTVYGLDWNADGTRLATGGQDNTVRIWDMNSDSADYLTAIEVLDMDKPVRHIAWSPDKAHEVLAFSIIERTEFFSDGATVYSSVYLWEVSGSRSPQLLEQDVPHLTPALAWDMSGSRLVTASLTMGVGYELKLWDTSTGIVINSIDNLYEIVSIQWNVYRDTFAVGDAISIATYNDSLEIVSSLPDQRDSQLQHRITSMDWKPGSDVIAIGLETGELQVWDSATGYQLTRVDAHPQEIDDIAWSPDTTRLATISVNDGLKVWDVGALSSPAGIPTVTPYPSFTPSPLSTPTQAPPSRTPMSD